MTQPLGSKRDGADQLIKTFGILRAAAFGTDTRFTVGLGARPWGLAALRAGAELSNRIKLMLPVQSWLQKYFDSLQTQITSLSLPFRPGWRGVSRSSRTRGMDADGAQTTAPKADGEVVWS